MLVLAFLLRQVPAAGREARVLELVRGIATPGAYANACFRSAAPALGSGPVIEPLALAAAPR